jgi:hypothetical protein
MTQASDLLCSALRERKPLDRGLFLREVLAHAAASLTLLEGEAAASEAVYRLADAMVGCTGDERA